MKFAASTLLLLSLVFTARTTLWGGFPPGGAGGIGAQPNPEQIVENKTLTDIDILNKLNAGETDNEIIHEIQTSATAFDTSQPSLVFLQRRGVSQNVINAMIKAAGGKPAPAPAPSAPPPPTPPPVEPPKTTEIKPKPPKPDMHKIRKVILEMDWSEDIVTRPKAIASLEKRTCLKVVDTLDAADAKLRWTTQGLMGVAIVVSSRDDVDLWRGRGVTPPLKALRLALGCEQ